MKRPVRASRVGSAVRTFVMLILLAACGDEVSSPRPESLEHTDAPVQLDGLELSVGELGEAFESDVTAYTATVGFLRNSVRVRASSDATVTVNGESLASGAWSAPIAIVAERTTVVVEVASGPERRVYIVDVRREPVEAFAQRAYMKASNPDAIDLFGAEVVLDGDTLAVGAYLEDGAAGSGPQDNSAEAAGAVYVFVRDAGQWRQQAYLKATNADPGDLFGLSVALDGDTLIVGAPNEDSAGTGAASGERADNSAANAGAAYVFSRRDGEWIQHAYLKASNAEPGDGFGQSVAVDGDTVAVGAPGEQSVGTGVNGGLQADNSGQNAGAVYVFTRADGAWRQTAYVKAFNAAEGDGFGHAVALDGDTLVATAPGEDSAGAGVDGGRQDDNSAENAGAVYVFLRSGGAWRQETYVKASNPDAEDLFGWSATVDGDRMAVGAPSESSDATNADDQADNSAERSGAVYVFARTDGVWRQEDYVKAENAGAGDQFGFSVALTGGTLAVGSLSESSRATGVNGADPADDSIRRSGAVYVFTYQGAGWRQQAYIKASNPDEHDEFGFRVAVDGDTLAVGARGEANATAGVNGGNESDNSAQNSGAVYLFQ